MTDTVSTQELADQLAAAHQQIAHLERALDNARIIGAAIGIIMATEKITNSAAFARLAEVSQLHNVKLRDLADEVVFTGALSPAQAR